MRFRQNAAPDGGVKRIAPHSRHGLGTHQRAAYKQE
jgi:hypothetical protein